MWNPAGPRYWSSAGTSDHASLFTTLIPPVIVAAIAAAVIFLFPDFVNSHDTAFAVTATLLLIAACAWTVDGEKELFSYSSFVNYFKFFPQTDVAFVTGEKFFAYIKRDPKTESLYQDFPVRD